MIALVGALALAPPPGLAATWVSYPALLDQVRRGPLIRAIINPGRGDIEIKFRDLSEWEAFFPAGAQPALQRTLHARHIRVLLVARHRPRRKSTTVHHHLRYIAAGLVGTLAMIGAGGFLYSRRRRATAAAEPKTPPA